MTDSPKATPHTPDESREIELEFTNAPNMLTLTRIFAVPLVVGLLFKKEPNYDMAASLVFGAAAITDYFDGYIARSRQLITVYGKLMDPLADKFLVVSSLVMLQYMDRIHPLVVMLLICRELAITGLRALASAEGVIIAASGGGKWKTAVQMVAIPFMMVKQGLWGIPLFEIGQVLLYLSLVQSLWSAKDYVVDFFKAFAEARKLKSRERRAVREARIKSRSERLAAKASRTQHEHSKAKGSAQP